MQTFVLSPLGLLLGSGLLGLVIGSFVNVVAFRVPIMMQRAWREHCAELNSEETEPFPPQGQAARFDLWWPPSSCPACNHRIRAWHNIPVVSYLWLRGRCADCGVHVSLRYPLVETAVALASLAVAWVYGPTWQTAVALPFTWCLIALTLIDFDHQLLPDSLTLPLLWAGLLVSVATTGGGTPFASLRDSVIGAAAGYLSLWAVYQLFKLATGKEGMGHGDFKLLAALGAWLGWQLLPLVILLSAAVGSVAGIAMLAVRGRSGGTEIPFGPYLAAAGWIALLWGPSIVGWYRHLMMP